MTIITELRKRAAARDTRRALRRLDDHLLRDIGYSPEKMRAHDPFSGVLPPHLRAY